MDKKVCSICSEEKELTEYYTQNRKSKDGVEWNYYNPECKECTKKRSDKWQKSIDPERRRAYFRKCDSKESRKKVKRDFSKTQKENGYFKDYQQQNKEKFSEYGKNRRMNKEHVISDQEWFECLDFFKDSCAYCGITEGEAFERYGQLLHKEHVDHNGTNDITNCVPACKGCNSLKHIFEFNEWYNENNPIFSKRRYNKIVKWLLSFAEEKSII